MSELPELTNENLRRVTPESLEVLLSCNGWRRAVMSDDRALSIWRDDNEYPRIEVPKAKDRMYEAKVKTVLAMVLRSGQIQNHMMRVLLAEVLAALEDRSAPTEDVG